MSNTAQQHIDQADSTRGLGAVGIRNADATMKASVHHRSRRRHSQITRSRTDIVRRHVAHRLGPLGRPSTGRLRQLVKPRGIAVNELVVVQPSAINTWAIPSSSAKSQPGRTRSQRSASAAEPLRGGRPR